MLRMKHFSYLLSAGWLYWVLEHHPNLMYEEDPILYYLGIGTAIYTLYGITEIVYELHDWFS